MKKRVEGSLLLAGGMGLLLMGILGGGQSAIAQTSVPHTFFPDTPAKADEVNENFKTVTDAINANTAVLSSVSPNTAPLPSGPQLMITSAEPDLSSLTNPTLLITGQNFSSTSTFTGSIFLYVPMQGKIGLNILGFDLAKQEILAGLPFGIETKPGTLRLRVESETGTQFTEGVVAIGTTGPKGDQGDTGRTGQSGARGPVGPKGDTGVTGVKGPKGDQGTQGLVGLKGNKGARGLKGAKGDQGIQGATGPMGISPFKLKGNDTYYNLGKVGIGTSTPKATLEIESNASDYTSLRLRNTQTADGIYELRSIQTGGPNNGFGIFGGQEGALAYRFVITKDGKVGIGFLDPKTKLSVNGTISAKAFSSLSPLIFEAPAGVERMRINDITGVISVAGVPIIDGGGNWIGSPSGIQGPIGPIGPAGAAGGQGLRGLRGPAGPTGATGPAGATGGLGPQGSSGTTSWTDGTGKVTTSQKVGIGTATPTAKLHVEGPSVLIQNDGPVELSLFDTSTASPSKFSLYSGSSPTGGRFRIDDESSGSGLTRLFINSFGNIGIGTISPEEKLHVVGKIKIVDGNQGNGKVFTSDANGVGTWQAAASGSGDITGVAAGTGLTGGGTTGDVTLTVDTTSIQKRVLGSCVAGSSIRVINVDGTVTCELDDTGGGGGGGWVDDGTVVRLDTASDKVGIGTTTPSEQLEITGNFNLPATTATTGIIKFGGVPVIHNFGTNNFFAGENAGNLTMNGNTNVGLGRDALRSNTTGNFNTASGVAALRLNTTGSLNTASGNAALFLNTTGSNNTAIGSGADVVSDNLVNATAIGANAKVGASNSLVLGANANVGIGTSVPDNLLHVEDLLSDHIAIQLENLRAIAGLELESQNGMELGEGMLNLGIHTNRALSEKGTSPLGMWFRVDTRFGSQKFSFFSELSGSDTETEVMSIQADGDVGIGVTNPIFPLHMGSGAHVTAGGVWTNASSRAYKENIKQLSQQDALSALKALQPVLYNYKVDKKETYVGFIAEDVPDLVATVDRKGLSPMDIVAVLTKVVQNQSEMLEDQQSEIVALRGQMTQVLRQLAEVSGVKTEVASTILHSKRP